jgi:hypothetical protein
MLIYNTNMCQCIVKQPLDKDGWQVRYQCRFLIIRAKDCSKMLHLSLNHHKEQMILNKFNFLMKNYNKKIHKEL